LFVQWVNSVTAPTLDECMSSSRPAWLWDIDRGRVVWANAAGVTRFGGETLFDLLDQPFDPGNEPLSTLRAAAGRLATGETAEEALSFPFTGSDEPLYCTLSLHILADGRTGMLATAADEPGGQGLARRLLAEAVGGMPLGLLLARADGSLLFANDAARELMGAERAASLGGWLGSEEEARKLVARAEAARVLTIVRSFETRHGRRDLRLTLRPIGRPDRAGSPAISVMAEDVTERRALERALGARAPQATPARSETTQKEAGSLSDRDRRTFEEVAAAIHRAGAGQPLPAETIAPAATTEAPAKAAETPAVASVPEIVSKPLDALPQAIVLFREGEVLFANRAALGVLGYGDRDSLHRRGDIASTLRATASGGEAEIATAGGARRRFRVLKDRFPWNSGPVDQATLDPAAAAAPPPETPRMPVPAPLRAADPPMLRASAVVPHEQAQSPESGPIVETMPEPAAASTVPASAPAPVHAWEPADAEFRAILDTATDGIIILDGEGRIRSFSAGAEALFGYRLAEVYGKALADLLAPESRKVLRNYLSALGDSGLASVFNDGREVEAVVSRGGTVPLFLAIGRIGGQAGDGIDGGFCVVLRDLTQWKRTEADLRQAKETAERASAQKSEFLANISHELRTPLNAILGFSEVMRSERFGEISNTKYLGYANDIHESGAHLLSLINDLLDLSKVEAGKFELNFTGVNLGSLIDTCLAIMQEQATAGRVVLRRNVPTGLPNVVADLRTMKQILLNLVANAIRFTDPGGQVIVSARLDRNGELSLSVKDTGIGMDEEELKAALMPFRRVETTGREAGRGTGLGLPLSKALVEANRARFSIASEPKKGTLVEIVFPTTRVLAE